MRSTPPTRPARSRAAPSEFPRYRCQLNPPRATPSLGLPAPNILLPTTYFPVAGTFFFALCRFDEITPYTNANARIPTTTITMISVEEDDSSRLRRKRRLRPDGGAVR